MNRPHGGKLVGKITSEKFDTIASIKLDQDAYYDLKNITTGVYSPLTGFMTSEDMDSVLENSRLSSNLTWTIPVFLSVEKKLWEKIKEGEYVELKFGRKTVGALKVEDKYKLNKSKYCKSVYGTEDRNHPGVAKIINTSEYLLGGEVWAYKVIKLGYNGFDRTPAEIRDIFKKHGWKTIVGFQTRNPAHRSHELIQKMALEFTDGLFVNPIIGTKKTGDFKDDVILEVYDELIKKFYPKASSAIGIYASKMHYAGPKEAVMHAIVRKNFGCTHFIVGRDHAGVGDYYDKFAAQEIFNNFPDLEMEILKFSNSFYCHRCKQYTTSKVCPHNEIYWVAPSGTAIRNFILEKNYGALNEVMRDEVLDIIFNFDEPFVK